MHNKLVFCEVHVKIFPLCSWIPSSWEGVAGIVTSTEWTAEELLFVNRQGQEVYLFLTASRAVCGPRVAAGEWGADHSPPFSTGDMEELRLHLLPQCDFMTFIGTILPLPYVAGSKNAQRVSLKCWVPPISSNTVSIHKTWSSLKSSVCEAMYGYWITLSTSILFFQNSHNKQL